MATRSEYGKREIEAAKSILIELMQILGEYREHMVLIGGWVPYFLFGAEHVGSTDVDIALDREQIDEAAYTTIRELLEARGYRQGDKPFIFLKEAAVDDGKPITVQVDFLAGEYGGTGKQHRHQSIQGDLKARKARGCDLAFDHHTKINVEGTMPGGAHNKVQVNLSSVVPFMVMKGMALHDRLKEKDGWDIYFCINRHPEGTEGLAKDFESVLENKLVQEGLAKIRATFNSVDGVGPTDVVDFEEISDRGERERIKRDAYERVNALLDILKIKEFEE